VISIVAWLSPLGIDSLDFLDKLSGCAMQIVCGGEQPSLFGIVHVTV